jgi:hypothetical protein
MRSIAPIRPAAALAVTSLALLAGFGGTAQAASSQVSGATLKRSSLPADRIKPNSLSGIQINEARLGLVPVSKLSQFAEIARFAETANHAKTADSAKTAETANSAKTADTARVADDAKKLNGRDHNAFLSNQVRTVANESAPLSGAGGGTPFTISVSCAPEEKAIGGGAAWMIPGTDDATALATATITASMPLPATAGVNNMTGWTASGRNTTTTNRSLRVYAICVPKNA